MAYGWKDFLSAPLWIMHRANCLERSTNSRQSIVAPVRIPTGVRLRVHEMSAIIPILLQRLHTNRSSSQW